MSITKRKFLCPGLLTKVNLSRHRESIARPVVGISLACGEGGEPTQCRLYGVRSLLQVEGLSVKVASWQAEDTKSFLRQDSEEEERAQ